MKGMCYMSNNLLNYVQEINQMIDEMSLHLASEYQDLMDNTVSSKQVVVLMLIHAEGAITTGKLAANLDITPSAVSQLLNRLEKNGYVKRTINPENRREILIELDQFGIDFFEKSSQIEQKTADKYYAKLGMEDVQELHRILLKLKNIVILND